MQILIMLTSLLLAEKFPEQTLKTPSPSYCFEHKKAKKCQTQEAIEKMDDYCKKHPWDYHCILK